MRTYKAPFTIIRSSGSNILLKHPVLSKSYITPGGAEFSSNRGKLMAEVLAELARKNTFAAIPDPVAWQRQLRAERALPDREA